jgi:hypothetical protein
MKILFFPDAGIAMQSYQRFISNTSPQSWFCSDSEAKAPNFFQSASEIVTSPIPPFMLIRRRGAFVSHASL